MIKIVLATSSKPRQDIFNMVGFKYDIITSNVPEDSKQTKPDKSVESQINEKAVIISADTIITCNNKIYEKPKSKEDAFIYLKELSNNKCTAYTGITIIDLYRNKIISTSYKISDEEIKWYVNNEEKILKCCGFVPEGKAALFINKIEGDYNTLLGISPSVVYNKLRELGYSIFDLNFNK